MYFLLHFGLYKIINLNYSSTALTLNLIQLLFIWLIILRYSQPVAAIFANQGGKSSWRIIMTFFKFKKGFPFHVNATHSGVANTRIGPYSFKWNKLSLQKKEKVVFMLAIVAWQFTMLKLFNRFSLLSCILEFFALISNVYDFFLRECLNEGLVGIYIILICRERD